MCGLRYISFDANLIVKDEVFPVVLTERQELVAGVTPACDVARCGVGALDNILTKIDPIDWKPFQTTGRNDEVKPPSERDYLLRTAEQILRTADGEKTPLVNHADLIHYFTGTHYKHANNGELRNFLIEAAIRCGVPSDVAVYQVFVEKIIKQFQINASRHNSGTVAPDTPYINLQNGTLFFERQRHRFVEHSPRRFIQYCLHFNYDSKATAPLWQQHLDRSLPSQEKQQYLAECLALVFYQGKIEKAPVLYGRPDTGKSTTLDTVKALFGAENISAESLAALTKSDYHGDYARARLDGKLVNIASDIGKKIHDEGMTKTLISREMVSARHPNQKGFDMTNYARLIFAMNDLPPQFLTDTALAKRAAVVEFDQQIASQDIKGGFVENIIENELPGVLNWIINGLDRLLKKGRLDAPQCCVEAMDRIRTELDPLSEWLAARGYQRGKSMNILVREAYPDFVECCKNDGNQVLSKKTFTKRLRDLGYDVFAPNNHIGVCLWYTRVASPVHSPLIPLFEPTNIGMGNEGNVGNEKLKNICDGSGNKCQHSLPATVSSMKPVETAGFAPYRAESAVQYPKWRPKYPDTEKTYSGKMRVRTAPNTVCADAPAKNEGNVPNPHEPAVALPATDTELAEMIRNSGTGRL